MKGDLAFDWDDANLKHIAAHDVTAAEAEQAMENDPQDQDHDLVANEERWTSIGHTDLLRVLIIKWTMRGERTRIVTAWEAGKKLRMDYFRAKGVL